MPHCRPIFALKHSAVTMSARKHASQWTCRAPARDAGKANSYQFLEARGRKDGHARPVELGDVGVGDLVERAVVHEALGLVDVLGIHLQFIHEELQDARVGVAGV